MRYPQAKTHSLLRSNLGQVLPIPNGSGGVVILPVRPGAQSVRALKDAIALTHAAQLDIDR